MRSPLEAASLRTRIVLSIMAVVLPAAAVVAGLLVVDLRQAREAAHAKVRLLADATAEDLQRLLQQAERVLGQVSARPAVQAMETLKCDVALAGLADLEPTLATLGTRNLRGAPVCAHPADPLAGIREGLPEFEEALRAPGLHVSEAMTAPAGGGRVSVLSYPVRVEDGRSVGRLTLPLDLRQLGDRLLASVPAHAVVTVADRKGAVLLRSVEARGAVARRSEPGHTDPPRVPPEGLERATAGDGEAWLRAVAIVPGAGWRVTASVPESVALAAYEGALRRAIGIGLGVVLIGVALAWHLGRRLAEPVARLAATARVAAAGATAMRAQPGGPPEVAAVAAHLNRMLDAHEADAAALRESEGRYRTLVEWSPEALSVHRDGKVVFVNRATVELLGAGSADELVGQDSLEFVHPDSRAGVEASVLGAIDEDRAIARNERRFVRRDGTVVDVEAQGTRIVLDGQPALLASMRDITQRKRVEAALQESEARLQAIFATASDAILTTDDRQHVVMANRAAAAMFRYRIDELVGAPIDRLIPERFRARHRADVGAFGASPDQARRMGCSRDVVGLRSDGEEFAIDAAISHFEVGGRQLYTVILRDITEIKQTQSALAVSHADLQRLFTEQDRVQEEERKRIARELHDDLQQTLAAIRMNLKAVGELLTTDPKGATALLDEVDGLAGAAIVSTRRIVNDLRPPILEDLGLVAALEMLASQFRQHSGIDCRVEASEDGGCEVESPAVATSLYRVAQESLNNVLKHSKATRVRIRLARTGDDLIALGVQDDGIGFDASARQKPQSLGLMGMSERIRALGGVLRIDSHPGGGTTIDVRMPSHGAGPH